ncbi:FecR family protein [Novosphingobium rosa]|uniref:FecR family protein n=1 Tax=Novosphingobium rosa TaxID=76978 RepID=UPI000834BD32|nr:FecR domain-containing protein [Novosphingobium rosa]
MDKVRTSYRASAWLIALQEAPDDADLRAAFALWLEQDPAHRQDWREMLHTHALMGLIEPAHAEQWEHWTQSKPAPRHGLPPWRWAAVAAMAACVMLAFAPQAMLRWRSSVSTATAEQRLVALRDGSRVRLAPESAIAIDEASGERHIRLLKGEAFFEVAHDARHPFRVSARGTEAVDIGTAFDLRLTAHGAALEVREGEVRVNHAHGASPVHAGGWLHLGDDGVLAQGQRPATQIGAWQDGQIIARDQPVSDVVDAITPYFHGIVLLRGASLRRQPLTGVYRAADPVGALRAVAEGQGARFYQITPWVLVIAGD